MIGRNRHNKYRRSVYKRHSLSAIIISSAVTLVVCIIAMLIFGNILHAKYEEEDITEGDQASETSSQPNTDIYSPPGSINAYSTLIETNDSTTFSTRLDSLPEGYKSAVSIPLNKKDGSLLYKSDIGNHIGYASEGFSVPLSSIASTANEKGVYLSGVYYVNDFSTPDALLRQVALSKSSAIISEALLSGINEVIIIAPDASADNISELIRFIDGIKYNSKVGTVGIAIPSTVFKIENETLRSENILLMSKSADILAIDASNLEQSASSENIAKTLNNIEKFYIHKYKMRVLLPKASSADEQSTVINTVVSASIDNWQILEY